MNVTHHVLSILEEADIEEEATLLAKRPDPLPFITISRQTGAGAHTLAELLREEAAQLGKRDPLFEDWYVFDSDLCHQLLETFHFHVPADESEKEEVRTPFGDFASQLVGKRRSLSDALRKTSWMLRSLAKRGKVILIGRGAMCITKDVPGGIHLRLRAPLPVRVERMQSVLNVKKRKAEKIIWERDAGRASFLKDHFHQDIDNPDLYHAVFNSSLIPADKITPLVFDMISVRRQPALFTEWSLQ